MKNAKANKIKVCSKGSSCGLTCIAESKVCRKGLPKNLASPLDLKSSERTVKRPERGIPNKYHADRFERWKRERSLERGLNRANSRLKNRPDDKEQQQFREQVLADLENEFPKNPAYLKHMGLPGPGERYLPDLTDKADKDYVIKEGVPQEEQQAEVYQRQGYNDKPKVVDTLEGEELWEAPNGSQPVFYRGVPEKEFQEEFKYGEEHYVGKGLYGNGTYTAVAAVGEARESEARQLAAQYAKDRGEIQAMGLRPGAAVFPDGWEDLNEFFREKYGPNVDVGLAAALEGFDAVGVMIGEKQALPFDYFVVYNRGALIVADQYEQEVYQG